MESINAYFEATVDELLRAPLRIVRESMQRIWQSFGYERCLLFDPKGEWVQAR